MSVNDEYKHFLKNVRIHRSFLVRLYKKLYKRISGLRYKTLTCFYRRRFLFHVSFLVSKLLIINVLIR